MTPVLSARSLFRAAPVALVFICASLHAQNLPRPSDTYRSTVVVPQQRSYAPDSVSLTPHIAGIEATVTINNLTAVTELKIMLRHPFTGVSNIAPASREKLTADIPFSLLIPIPERAILVESRMEDLMGMPTEMNAGDTLPVKAVNAKFSLTEFAGPDARNAFHTAAVQVSNPTLLEFLGNKLMRCGDFILSRSQACNFTLIYEEPLTLHGNRVDYLLPRSESFAFRQIPWRISVKIASSKTIAGIYSPSHPVEIDRLSATQASIEVQALTLEGMGERKTVAPTSSDGSGNERELERLEAGPFRLSWMLGNELTASLIASPREEGGRFLMVAGAPPLEASTNLVVKREVILVIDRSGSMRGEKMEQVREAALKILEELNDGEAFNIVDYADSVRQYAGHPVIKNEATLREAADYVRNIAAFGGTNIDGALEAALSQKPTRGFLPIVIFLTDGTPTVGVKEETRIRERAKEANDDNRRIFSFGVGYDLNPPLLDAIATESKGTSTFAMPFDDAGVKITNLFRQLAGPVFSDIELSVTTPDGRDASHLVAEIFPEKINDMFDGDRLVLLGSYLKNEPLIFTLRGNYLGTERSFYFTFDPTDDLDPDAPWIYRLWANRKIMSNVARISQAGAVPKESRSEEEETELKRMTEEIVRLSTANGIVTEYTDYLAQPTTDVADVKELERMAAAKLKFRAQEQRVGKGAINQTINTNSLAIRNGQSNRTNAYLDENLQMVEITSVQQIHDLTFFRRTFYREDSRFVDSTGDIRAIDTVRDTHSIGAAIESAPVHTIEGRVVSLPLKNLVMRYEEFHEDNVRMQIRKRMDPVGTVHRFEKRWVDARILDSAGIQHPDRTIQFGTPEYYGFVTELIRDGRQGILALDGDILLEHDEKIVLITGSPTLE